MLLVSLALAAAPPDPPPPELGQVCFARQGRFVGSGIPFGVNLEGQLSFFVGNKRYRCVLAEPATYSVGVLANFVETDVTFYGVPGTPGAFTGFLTSPNTVFGDGVVEVSAGETTYAEIWHDTMKGGIGVQQMDEAWFRKKPLKPIKEKHDHFASVWTDGHVVPRPPPEWRSLPRADEE